MTKVFVLGITGYIGGDAFYALERAHPDLEYTALVRQSPKVAKLAATYPKLRLVYGSLESRELITAEAQRADITLSFASADDEPGSRAIAEGIASKPAGEVGYWIHLSGTGSLTYGDSDRGTYGEHSDKVFDDWEGIREVTALPAHALHVNVDRIVLDASEAQPDKVRAVVVTPPCIYGLGRGAGNTRSIQVPELARVTLERGHAVQIGKGLSRWSGVHVADLADLFVLLVEDALAGGKKASWGRDGYYYAEDHDFAWGEVSKRVAVEGKALGLLESDEVHSITADEGRKVGGFGHLLWGANSRSRAVRAKKLLGWAPSRSKDVNDDVRRVVEDEAKALGKIPSHAAKAAGDA